MFCVRNPVKTSGEAVEDLVNVLGPDERLGIVVACDYERDLTPRGHDPLGRLNTMTGRIARGVTPPDPDHV